MSLLKRIIPLFLVIGITLQLNSCGASDVATFIRAICGGYFVSDGDFTLVGASGTSIRTTDNGGSYTVDEVPVIEDLTDFAKNAGVQYAVGKNSTYLTRTSFGARYEFRDLGVRADYNDLEWGDTQNGYIAASNGYIIRTWDAGLTWDGAQVGSDLNRLANFYSVGCADGLSCWAVGSGGSVYRTEDGFQNFRHQDVGTTNDLHYVLAVDDNTACAVGDGGFLSMTVDGGENWRTIDTGTNADLYRIALSEDRLNQLLLGDAYAGFSSDGGVTWNPSIFDEAFEDLATQAILFKLFLSLNGLDLTLTQDGLITGDTGGFVFRTNDYGRTFTSERIVIGGTNSGDNGSLETGSGNGVVEPIEPIEPIEEGTGSGSGIIQEPTATPQETATPTPTPEEKGVLEFTVSDQNFSFAHSVGSTECPQKIGQFVVTNSGTLNADYTIDINSFNGAISMMPSSFSLEPGQTQTVMVFFTCSQASSFSGNYTIQAASGDASTGVNGSIQGNVG